MLRRLRWLLSLILSLPLIYVLAGFAGALWTAPGLDDAAPRLVRLGLLRGPIHYDLLLPLDPALRDRFAFAEAEGGVPLRHPQARWLLFGWGSAAFYTTAGRYADIAPGAVWTAMTGDSAVIRLDVLPDLPADQPGLVWLDLTAAEYARLLQGLETDFTRDSAGRRLPLPAALSETDGFWQAEGHFDLGRTCNVWLGQQLRAAGLPFGRWTPTVWSVNLSLWWTGRASG